jgi:proline iminopeptidase
MRFSSTALQRASHPAASSVALAFLVLSAAHGCGDEADSPPSSARPAEAPAPRAQSASPPSAAAAPRRCGDDASWSGAEVLEASDGARLYYRVAGPADAPAVVFLHGGPGGNALAFERSVGARLEASLRVVTLDQRGCARSNGGPENLALGMDETIADLERLRAALGIARWTPIAHSFGGLQALAYASRHPDAIERVVLVEGVTDPSASLQHQVEVLAEGGSAELQALARGEGSPFDRMLMAYQLLGRAEVQRRLHWVSPEAQRRAEGWERDAGLAQCTRDGVLGSYRAGGWIEPHPELVQRLRWPTLFVAGRQSRVFGGGAVQAAAEALGAEVRWLEQSGHFPFVEEPEAFAELVTGFVRSPSAPQ